MEVLAAAPGRMYCKLNLDDISPNPAQPRQVFSDDALDELAASIQAHGLLSPLIVRRIGAGKYELVAGERRYRALKKLGQRQAEAIIIAAFDCDSALIALVENIQREQLNYIEEAEACRAIIDNHGLTQEQLARRLGRSPSALANRLRLIRLPAGVKELLITSGLSERHGRALLSIDDPDTQLALAREAATKKLTVRQLEQRIARINAAPRRKVRGVYRDMRLYVNAVMDTVSRLRNLGATAEVEITQTDAGVDVIIHIGRSDAGLAEKTANMDILPSARQSTPAARL